MMGFEINREEFLINGKPQFFLCGEIHYFRISKEHWEDVLDRLVECGCNAVAYYVPWFVHEYEEGEFDFTGEVHLNNDLHSWIALTKKKGLMGFLRPGPYTYAESTDLGVPKWFSRAYPDARVKGYKNGEYYDIGNVNFVSHNHPDFLHAVKKWYQALLSEIKDYMEPEGNIVMIQLCNEIPGEDIDDRNPVTLGIGCEDGLLPSFLKHKYKTVEGLKGFYGAEFEDLFHILPHQLEEINPVLAKEDHLEFYYDYYYPQYFDTLMKMVKECGITTYLTHNAYNPRALSLHHKNCKINPWLNMSVDCYYSLFGQLNMQSATYFCEYGAEYMHSFLKCVPWVAEQECGYWFDAPKVYGPELYIWNIWTFAAGYRGMNMYLFASGKNRKGMGFYGTDHNWQAPIGLHGEKQESFVYIQQSIQDIKKDKEIFRKELKYDIALGVKNDPGLIWKKVAKESDEAFYVLKTAGFTPRLCDFQSASVEELLENKCLWVVSDEMMDGKVQNILAEYAEKGGHLIVSGRIPCKDEKDESCTFLAEALGIKVKYCEEQEEDQQKMVWEEVEYDIGRSVQPMEIKDEYIVARDRNGNPCIGRIPYGNGIVCVMGFTPRLRFRNVADAILRLLKEIEVYPLVQNARYLRVLPKEGGESVVLNLHPVQVKEEIQVLGKNHEVVLEPYSYCILEKEVEEVGTVSGI